MAEVTGANMEKCYAWKKEKRPLKYLPKFANSDCVCERYLNYLVN